MEHRRAGDDRGRMRVDLRNPSKRAGVAVDSHDVRAVVLRGQRDVVADDQLVVVNRRAHPRDAAGPTVVLRDLMGPQQLSGMGPNGVQVARPIGKVHGVTRDGRCRGHVAAGGEHPFRDESADVAWVDLFVGQLTSRVVQVAAGDAPAAQSARVPVPVAGVVLVLRLGDIAESDRHHRHHRKRQAADSPLSCSHASLLLTVVNVYCARTAAHTNVSAAISTATTAAIPPTMVGANPTAAPTAIRTIAARTTKIRRTTLRLPFSSSVRPCNVRVVNGLVMTTTSTRFKIQQAFHRVSTEFGAARAHVGGWAARLRTICVSAFGDAYFDRRSRRQYRVQVIDGSSARITGESIWQLASTLPAEPRVAHVSASVLPFCL